MKPISQAIQIVVLTLAIVLTVFSPGAIASSKPLLLAQLETAPAEIVLFPQASGQALLNQIAASYTPKQTLNYQSARDLMYGSIDNNNNIVTDVYTGYSITLSPGKLPRRDAYNKGINAEHTWPQSRGAKGRAKSDIHHLFPSRIEVNSTRGNLPFGEIPDRQTLKWYRQNQQQTTIPTQFIDEYSEANSGLFEPREDHKGNVARAMFYFNTIYNNQTDPEFFESQKNTLCTWHLADPVDAAEIARSHAIAQVQGNENPFVIDSTLATRTYCHSGAIADKIDPDTPTTESKENQPTLLLTPIHSIQGRGATSPMKERQDITIEGIVVGDFQDTNLKGFYVQEEDADVDTSELTSEGIFVYAPSSLDVQLGDKVQVTGTADEFYEQTQLDEVSVVTVEDEGLINAVTPTPIELPLSDDTILEQYEGMLVTLPQTLTVSDTHNLGRYGEIVLSNGRLFTPTTLTTPGAAAQKLQLENDLNRIIIDDGSTEQNPEVIAYPTAGLSANQSLRDGDTVTGITGVLAYSWSGERGTNHYRLHPIAPPTFISQNPRLSQPKDVGGRLKVASFNLLNYFNGDGSGGGFPTPRGADSSSEFSRQRAKIIEALVQADADIVGLMELENDGYGTDSAIANLVEGLNSATAPDTYRFVDPGLSRLGTDAIAVGLIYRPQSVEPVGNAVTLATGAFSDKNRQPLAQTFAEKATGETFTVVVNHFKSKGGTGRGLDADQGDGQGNWNQTRVQAATDLTHWLDQDPTNSHDPDILIIGDLNAYAKEDPITAIKSKGYTNLIERSGGRNAYSFVFSAQAGYLDHALASASLTPQVTGLTEWHINADEPSILDYNEEFKSPRQRQTLYASHPYRSSDHDPLIIGISLGI